MHRRGVRWIVVWAILISIVAVPNAYLTLRSIGLILGGEPAVDWTHFVEASRRVFDGGLYELSESYGWRYSPIAAYAFGVLAVMGTSLWRLLHIAAAFAMPNRLMIALTLASWPFWWDVQTGNTMVFFLLAGAWAIKGNRFATGAYLVGVLLIPRPLFIPLLLWLLWKRPEWRIPFGVMVLVHGIGVLATGWAGEWLGELLHNPKEIGSATDVGPTRLIGDLWLLVGIPLGLWLTWKSRLGWASVSFSPYLLPYYLLMLLLELVPRRTRSAIADESTSQDVRDSGAVGSAAIPTKSSVKS